MLRIHIRKGIFLIRWGVLALSSLFIASSIIPVGQGFAQNQSSTSFVSAELLPAPGQRIMSSRRFEPMVIKGINLNPTNPLQFDFIVDPGDSSKNLDDLEQESKKLIKYFLTALTIPENELWVNLSPYEQNRIIPQSFSQTEMGRDLLALDYILKQLTASMIYPEDDLGQKFWERVHQKAMRLYGSTDLPMHTFNKVWIVPEQATIFEHSKGMFVVHSRLKVMLEADYLALEKNSLSIRSPEQENKSNEMNGVSSDIVRELIIPEIEREINEGKTFANLRQIYHSMILAVWYKQTLKESFLNQVYADQQYTSGIEVDDKMIHHKIYDRYLEAFKKGVYDYIKEDVDPRTQQPIPRRYFSGGVVLNGSRQSIDQSMMAKHVKRVSYDGFFRVRADFLGLPTDEAALAEESVEYVIRDRLYPYRDQNIGYHPFDAESKGHVLKKVPPHVLSVVIDLVEKHHLGQVRADGFTVYATHPLNVAAIYLHEMGLTDAETLVAALMHDVIENTISYYTDKDINELTVEEATHLRQSKSRKPRLKKILIRKANQLKNELRAKGLEEEGLNLDKVFDIVLALSKYDSQRLLENYFQGIVNAGPNVIAAKVADQIHNLRSNAYANNPAFVEKYIFGDHGKKGSIELYLEARLPDSGIPFLDHLPAEYAHIKTFYQINLIETILDNLHRIDAVKNKREAVHLVERIAPNVKMDKGFKSRRDAFKYALEQLRQDFEDQSMLARKEYNGDTKGGIDLNAAYLDFNVLSNGSGVSVPSAIQPMDTISIKGFVPIIQEIVPIQDLPRLIGDSEQNDQSVTISHLD